MSISSSEKIRYSRQLMGHGFSEEKQEALKRSTVLVAGVGGLGGTVALSLAAAGVGKLIIVHAGELELPDMNRQTLMNTRLVGMERVKIAQRRLREINPHTEVISFSEWITPGNVDEIVSKTDIVMDCRHNFEERFLLNKACFHQNKVMVEGAMDDMFGYLTTIVPRKTPCLNCLFPESTQWDYLGFAVMGVIPGTLGNLMALEAVKVITGTGEPLYSKLLTFDGGTMTFEKLSLGKESACSICGIGQPTTNSRKQIHE
jgi:molybdopterin/thiamine biosynthesis adenylyltransferase